MSEPIQLLIVDDYPVVLSGLQAMLQSHAEIEVVGVANSGRQAVDLALSLRPQVVLMNVSMPGIDGIEATQLIKKSAPEINVLIFSGLSSHDKVTPAINAGAIGYILKDASELELLRAIQQVSRGEACLHPSVVGHVLKQIQEPGQRGSLLDRLTERELEVLKLMADGHSNQEIAKLMVVGMATVHSHVSRILAKLEVSSRTQAVIFAIRSGVIPPPDGAPPQP